MQHTATRTCRRAPIHLRYCGGGVPTCACHRMGLNPTCSIVKNEGKFWMRCFFAYFTGQFLTLCIYPPLGITIANPPTLQGWRLFLVGGTNSVHSTNPTLNPQFFGFHDGPKQHQHMQTTALTSNYFTSKTLKFRLRIHTLVNWLLAR